MPKSSSAHERPTLPSIQEMFSDLQFESLRLQSTKNEPNTIATINATAPPLRARTSSGNRSLGAQSHVLSTLPSSRSPTISSTPRTPNSNASRISRPAPYPDVHQLASVNSRARGALQPPAVTAGLVFMDQLPRRHTAPPPPATSVPSNHQGSSRSTASQQMLELMGLPTYVLSADECPPDDDRRHGCGICHRRFNRPSSLMIHMNSHTGAQPFECPFPGCTRRFSVNSNMRRHYRNHREGATAPPQPQPFPSASYYSTPEPLHPYYHIRPSPSPSSSSSSARSSSGTDSDGRSDTTGIRTPSGDKRDRVLASSLGRVRSHSSVLPRARDRVSSRPRSCTVPGCDCNEAPSALRPAFQQGSSTRAGVKRPGHR